jgi:SulP family sulfate permease
VGLAAVSVGTALLGWDAGPNALPGIGEFASAWTSASALDVPDLKHVAQPAFAIAILVTLQSVAAARSVRPPAGSGLDPDRELFGQGAGNIVSALVGGMVTCGSLTRTAVARSAGRRSRLTAVVAGGVILVGLPGLGLVVNAVPMPALVGLVVLSGIELVDPRALRRAATTRGDALVLRATLGSTQWIHPVQALYVGLFLSLALLVRRSGDLQIVELVRSPNGRFREIDEQTGSSPAVLLHLKGDLNFAIAGDLSDRLVEVGCHAHPKYFTQDQARPGLGRHGSGDPARGGGSSSGPGHAGGALGPDRRSGRRHGADRTGCPPRRRGNSAQRRPPL